MNYAERKKEAQDLLQKFKMDLTTSREALEKLLVDMGTHYNHSFNSQLNLSARGIDTSFCLTFDDWNRVAIRRIHKNTHGIPILTKDGKRIKKYLFDISQTYTTPYTDMKMKKWNISENLKDNVLDGVLLIIDNKIRPKNELSELSDIEKIKKIISNFTINEKYSELLNQMLLVSICSRCNVDYKNEDLSLLDKFVEKSKLNSNHHLEFLEQKVAPINYAILEKIENELSLEKRKEKNRRKANERERKSNFSGERILQRDRGRNRTIYSSREEEFHGKEWNEIQANADVWNGDIGGRMDTRGGLSGERTIHSDGISDRENESNQGKYAEHLQEMDRTSTGLTDKISERISRESGEKERGTERGTLEKLHSVERVSTRGFTDVVATNEHDRIDGERTSDERDGTESKYNGSIEMAGQELNTISLQHEIINLEQDSEIIENVEVVTEYKDEKVDTEKDEFEEKLSPDFEMKVDSIMEEQGISREVAISSLVTTELENALKGTNFSISDFSSEQLEIIRDAIKYYDFYGNEITEIADPNLSLLKMEMLIWMIDDWNNQKFGVTAEKIKYLKSLDINIAKLSVLKDYLVKNEVSISQIEEFKDKIESISMSEFVDSLNEYASKNKNEKVAIKVGNEFILASKQDSLDIVLEETGRKVEVESNEYTLYKGETYKESKKVDNLIDSGKYKSYIIDDYEIKDDLEKFYINDFNSEQLEVKHNDVEVIENNTTKQMSFENFLNNDDKEVETIIETKIMDDNLNLEKDIPALNYKTNRADEILLPSQRLENNIEAIKLLKQLEKENNRQATPQEQEILSKYVGWGGLADVFDENKGGQWSKARNFLLDNLTEDEFYNAMQSTLTSFYTPPEVIDFIYKAIDKFGIKSGNFLEPSCGIGNFFSKFPEKLKENSRVYGIEIDSISSKIAKQLYPEFNILHTGYENFENNNFFDVAIGNIPFGNYRVYDTKYNKLNYNIHDYFFAKTIDQVTAGGVIAFITSSGTMDKTNNNVRKYISDRCDFIGAVRLPNTTFKSTGTNVMSDIIFLQKKNRVLEVPNELTKIFTETTTTTDGLDYNRYFLENSNMILGKLETVSGQFGNQLACIEDENESLSEKLNKALDFLPSQLKEYENNIIENDNEFENWYPADLSIENNDIGIIDEKIYHRVNKGMFLIATKDTTNKELKNKYEILKDFIYLRNSLNEVIKIQLDEIEYEKLSENDAKLKSAQKELSESYNNFNEKHGRINSKKNVSLLREYNSFLKVCNLEIMDKNKKFEKLSDIFTERTIKANVKVESVDTSYDAMFHSMSTFGKLNFEFMKKLLALLKKK